MEKWVNIPGWPTYQINQEGEVRRVIRRGNEKNQRAVILKPYYLLGADCVRMVKDGKRHYVPVARIVADVFLGGVPDGHVIYFRNGDKHDPHWRNIAFETKQEMGRRTGASATRRPVKKINEAGEVIAFYSSARKAASENFCSQHYVTERCNKKIVKEFSDGFSFRWDK